MGQDCMEPDTEGKAQETVKVDRRHHRKKSPKKPVDPVLSAIAKARWQDPVLGPKLRAAQLRNAQKLREDPNFKGRHGVPDGYSKAEAEKMWAEVRAKAKETIKQMEDQHILDDADDMAKAALAGAIEVLLSPVNQQHKLQAARLILDFTKAKPASKSEITVNKAEEWLAQVASSARNEGQ
jgi:hypothetical protein